MREVPHISSARRLKHKIGEDDEVELELEDSLPLTEALRPSPAIIGRTTRTIFCDELQEIDEDEEVEVVAVLLHQ